MKRLITLWMLLPGVLALATDAALTSGAEDATLPSTLYDVPDADTLKLDVDSASVSAWSAIPNELETSDEEDEYGQDLSRTGTYDAPDEIGAQETYAIVSVGRRRLRSA